MPINLKKQTTGKIFLLLLLSYCITACSTPMYLVTSKYTASQQRDLAPEVIESPAYKEMLGSILAVGIRAPDSCANETTSSRTGEASGRGAIRT